MTADQKRNIAHFLDLSGDLLSAGYRADRGSEAFEDDPPPGATLQASSLQRIQGAVPRDIASAPFRSIEAIAETVSRCKNCPLWEGRKHTVSGEGSLTPTVMVIGEGPGAEEDATGRPFVGKAGQLLDKMLSAIDLSRGQNAFIANVVKCRPPNNRDPEQDEAEACAPFLSAQIALLKPRFILAVGRVAAQRLLHTEEGVGKLRGRFFEYQGIPVLVTYHPSALLRNETLKRPAWEDLKLLRVRLDKAERRNDAEA